MENAEKLRSFLKRVDTVYSGYFIAWNFGDGPSVLSRMGKLSLRIRENVKFISKHTGALLNGGGVRYAVCGEWSYKRGERFIFTSYTLIRRLSQLGNGTTFGMIAHAALLLRDTETQSISRLVGDRLTVTLCQNTWESILESRINELMLMNKLVLEGGGENGI